MADTVLNLSTTDFDRPKVAIDGEVYEMRSPEELSVATVRQMVEIASSLEAAEDDDIDTVALNVSRQLDLVMVNLPEEVKDKLTLGQHTRIVKAFSTLVRADGSPASAESS